MAKSSRKKKDAQIASKSDGSARRALCGSIAVLPVGSTEQHGAHLPVSTDADIAKAVCARVCAITGYALLPSIPYGVSFEHAPALNLSVRGPTLRALVSDIASSIADAGARGLVIVNGHYGNKKDLARLPKKIRGHAKSKTIPCMVVPYWDYTSARFDHAGNTETSLMLACGAVDMSKAKKGFIEPELGVAAHKALARRASVSFMSVAKNGVWGDPRSARRARGLLLLDEIASNIAGMCRKEFARKTAIKRKSRT